MREENEQYAYFSVTGDFDPAEITACVGVAPSQSWIKGDKHPNGRERLNSRWSLYSRLPMDRPLEDHIRDVILQLDARSSEFRDVASRHEAWMQCVGYFWSHYPGVGFDRRMVVDLARYNLSVDFDFYGLYSHRLQDTEA